MDPLLTANSQKLKSLNGLTGTSPNGYTWYWEKMDSEGRQEWFDKKHFRPDTVYIIK